MGGDVTCQSLLYEVFVQHLYQCKVGNAVCSLVTNTSSVIDMSAIVANEQLVLKERTARDMQYWDLLHNVCTLCARIRSLRTRLTLIQSYARDGQVRVSWYSVCLSLPLDLLWFRDRCRGLMEVQGHINGFVEGSKQIASRPGLQVLHVLQPPVVWLNKDETRGAVVLGAVITSRSTITDDAKQDVLVDIESHSRLMYTTVIEDGEWKIRSVDCVYLKDGIKAVLPGGHLVIRPQSVS